MHNRLSILTENLAFLSSPSGNSFRFARIGIRTTLSVRLFVSISSRWMPSCAIIPVWQVAPSPAAIVGFASSHIREMRIGRMSAVRSVAVSTIVANRPTSGARGTIEQTRDARIRSFSTGSGARLAAASRTGSRQMPCSGKRRWRTRIAHVLLSNHPRNLPQIPWIKSRRLLSRKYLART